MGWPYIVGGHGGQRYVDAPKDAIETEAPADHSQHDDFMSDTLDLNWNTLRVPFDGEMGKVGGGVLELRGQGSLWQPFRSVVGGTSLAGVQLRCDRKG